jgi:hypothetical protein
MEYEYFKQKVQRVFPENRTLNAQLCLPLGSYGVGIVLKQIQREAGHEGERNIAMELHQVWLANFSPDVLS